jgi:hypothetical protein
MSFLYLTSNQCQRRFFNETHYLRNKNFTIVQVRDVFHFKQVYCFNHLEYIMHFKFNHKIYQRYHSASHKMTQTYNE